MKTLINSVAASALILAFAAPASAAVSADIAQDVRAAAGYASNVRVNVDGDTVILTGYVEDTFSLQAIESAAKREGATTVINNVLRSR